MTEQSAIHLESKSTSLKNIFLWSSYDAADTLFSQSILSIAFQPFVLLLAYEHGIRSYWNAFVIMSAFMVVSNILVAILGPIIGAFSDTIGKRKVPLVFVASLMCLSTLGFMVWRNLWWALIMFVVANFSYQAGRMLYDSMIPFLAKTEERGKTSGISGALSFLGTFAAVALGMVAWKIWGEYSKPEKVYNGDASLDYGGLVPLFGITVAAIVLFALPFLFSREKENPNQNGFHQNLRDSIATFKNTLQEIFHYKNALIFILGWFFITDASNTAVLYMQLVIVDGAGATPNQALMIIALGGLLSMIGAIVVGLLLDKFGPKLNFIVNIFAWIIAVTITVLACIEVNGQHIIPWQSMFLTAFFIGIGFGGIWLIGRQFVFEIAPPDKVAQYSGFKSIAGRVSAILSPLTFLIIFYSVRNTGISVSNSYAIALSPLILFFFTGLLIILKYTDVHKEYLLGERAPYKKLQNK
ncbi:MAG: MFS transporter [Candidatus Heimdallarchaeaceae archaeon]